MIFARLGVDIYCHPRFIKAGFDAVGYWALVLAYLRHHESSDGFLADELITVPLGAKRSLCRKLCERLVAVGLFDKVDGGYVFARYAEKNDTKDVIEENKIAARERKGRFRSRPDPRAAETRSDVAQTETPRAEEESVPPHYHSHSIFSSDSSSVSGSGFVSPEPDPARDPLQAPGGVQRGDAAAGQAGARHPLPASERAVSGSFWLTAFTDGIAKETGRPCTAGRMYVATLERIVEHHAPDRSAPRACEWLSEQAAAFAAKWDGKFPPKGLTPDGLERWLNEGRSGPPQFGRPRNLQLPPEEWKPDDFSDLGAVTVTLEGRNTLNGKVNTRE